MLQLNAEQVGRLQALKLERDLARLSRALERGFPDIPARLGERYPLLIRHGVLHAAGHGLTHGLCVARYLACWFALGAEFERKPGFAWALAILDAPTRSQGAKVFQLCRRTGEELARLAKAGSPGAGAMAPSVFDRGIAEVDAASADSGPLGSLVPGGRVQLGEACDVDAFDLRPADAAALLLYRFEQEQWQRVPATAARSVVTVVAQARAHGGSGPDETALGPAEGVLPERLHLLSPSGTQDLARLRLRTMAERVCDPEVHPLVTVNGPQGLNEWRGRQAHEIVLAMHAAAPVTPAGPGPSPVMAAETAPQYSLLSLNCCGLRDDGPPVGSLGTQLAVYPADQYLLTWQREPGPQMSWPDPRAERIAQPARIRIEREGVAMEGTRWRLGLEDLDQKLLRALDRLATAWERESGVTEGRLEAQPQLLCGRAAITWGWSEALQGMIVPPYFRVAGWMDLVACQLNLRFSGQLRLEGSSSHLSLHCAASEPLRVGWERTAGDADLPALLSTAQVAFRQPFVLAVDPHAWAELGVADAAAPVTGGLVGSCGLRPRPDGSGLQWFAKLSIEPVHAVLHLHDPLLGESELLRPLLPAMELLDWSLG